MAMLCEIPKSCMYKGNFLSKEKKIVCRIYSGAGWILWKYFVYFFGAGIFLK